ncbi:MAG: molecular chaperone [Leptolyngbyaceae cyanobacterium]
MKTLMQSSWLAAGLLGIGMMTASPVLAGGSYQLSPNSMTLSPNGSRATGVFQVTSTGTEPVAIEVRIYERQMDINGVEARPDAEEEFMVYPPQILLQPGETQTIRVTWLGEPDVFSEQAYRLITEQLPINLDTSGTAPSDIQVGITALYRYVASVYVSPRGAESDVQLNANHEVRDGSDALVLSFDNQGTAHQLLSDLTLTLTAGNDQVELGPDQLRGVAGENVLAQHQREFVLPWPEALPVGAVDATFDISGGR